MDIRTAAETFLDSLATLRSGDLLGLENLSQELARFPLPSDSAELRKARKKILGLFGPQMKEGPGKEFLELLGDLVRCAADPSGPLKAGDLMIRAEELDFDHSVSSVAAEYPDDYFDHLTNDPDIMSKFVEEARDHLQQAQLSLLDVEKDPTHPQSLHTLFRAFHTLKGSAGFLGLRNIEELSHGFEEILSRARDGELSLGSPEIMDVIFYAMTFLGELVEIIPACGYRNEEMIRNFRIHNIFPLAGLAREIIAQSRTRKIGEILSDMGAIAPDLLADILRRQAGSGKKLGQMITESGLASTQVVESAIQTQKADRERVRDRQMVKVSAGRLNSLVDLAGELVIIQSMIREALGQGDLQRVEASREQLETVSITLKDLALSMGMVPVRELFNPLRIVVRNTARDLGRLVNLEVEGEDTELDRKLVETLQSPLVHMLRNAVDHGLESPADRTAAGKLETGRIYLRARHRNNAVEIVVEDDGRGMDPGMLAEKALSRGIITPEKARLCTQNPSEAWKLIFLPGFSTKDKATEISGRGVGMDVVKTNLDSMGARMDIWSKPGKGSRFTIRIPLSLAIIDGFVCSVGRKKYIFPFAELEEILVWPPAEGVLVRQARQDDACLMEYRGDFVAVRDARDHLMPGTGNTPPARRPLLILKHEDHCHGLLVDEALGKQEVVIKSLDSLMMRIPHVVGGSIFGDGSIGFIVDMDSLFTGEQPPRRTE